MIHMSDHIAKELENKILSRKAVVGIVGLGYVGLPLVVSFAEAGFKVLGFDVDAGKVKAIGLGKSHIGDVSEERLSAVVKSNHVESTDDLGRLGEPDVICICVPTPLTKTKEPDLSYVVDGSGRIAKTLRKGQLVVLESTTYPGTTRQVIQTMLEKSGLACGKDFFLAYSPERVDPGSRTFRLNNTPKIVGGANAASARLVNIFYGLVVAKTVPVSSPEAAEMAKVFENVFRSVNIALVNEMALLCEKMGISVWEVLAAAATKPFGFMSFLPGPGIGGHCIPLDPYYLANKAREYDFHTRFIELAAEINEQMPYHVIDRIMEGLDSRGKTLTGAKVVVLGVTYKKDVADTRESPALRVIELLIKKGARVSYNDPYIPRITVSGSELRSVTLTKKTLAAADCALIATDHSSYDIEQIVRWAGFVFDTRGATRALTAANVKRLGE